MTGVSDLRAALRDVAEPDRVAVLEGFFKTGPGQYGEGDVFIGVRVPAVRAVAKEFADRVSLAELEALLESDVHEERLLALLTLVRQFARGSSSDRSAIVGLYLSRTDRVNNWDLVDSSAPQIVGGWLLAEGASERRSLLDRLAGSSSLWERRIAMVATQAFIRAGELDDTWRLASVLLGDREDLIHKATGWMLREAGKRDEAALVAWLDEHAAQMPRTALRYAIERLPDDERRRLMAL